MELLTPECAAALFSRSPDTIRRLTRDGKLDSPVLLCIGGKVRQLVRFESCWEHFKSNLCQREQRALMEPTLVRLQGKATTLDIQTATALGPEFDERTGVIRLVIMHEGDLA